MIAKFFTGKWSAYLSGAAIALFFIIALYVLDSPAGMSDAYIVISKYCEESIHARKVKELPFLDWQTGFLGGILIGAFIASLLGGDWKLRMFPEGGEKGIIASTGITAATGLAGGFLVMLGLQIAGDSFLGQWAAAMQLSTGAWLFFVSLLVWGIIFTAIIAAKFAKNPAEGGGKEEKKANKEKS